MKLTVFRPNPIEYTLIETDIVKKPGKGIGLSCIARKDGKGIYLFEVVSILF